MNHRIKKNSRPRPPVRPGGTTVTFPPPACPPRRVPPPASPKTYYATNSRQQRIHSWMRWYPDAEGCTLKGRPLRRMLRRLTRRNEQVCKEVDGGASIRSLGIKYDLDPSTIRNIYTYKEDWTRPATYNSCKEAFSLKRNKSFRTPCRSPLTLKPPLQDQNPALQKQNPALNGKSPPLTGKSPPDWTLDEDDFSPNHHALNCEARTDRETFMEQIRKKYNCPLPCSNERSA